MNLSGNTVLITGGATGIGFELAKAFAARHNTVILCGRRQEMLEAAQKHLPGIFIFPCDLADAQQRRLLAAYCIENHPSLNLLINNAGIQRELDLRKGEADFMENQELSINLEASIHLSALLIPHLMKQASAAIVNVSSALGFVPLRVVPVYCATKAALHSFSVSMRLQLQGSSVRVFELIPPIVDTQLDQGARHRRGQAQKGIPAEAVARAALRGMERGRPEIAVGMGAILRLFSRFFPALFLRIVNRSVREAGA